jgi:hypothetical protein
VPDISDSTVTGPQLSLQIQLQTLPWLEKMFSSTIYHVSVKKDLVWSKNRNDLPPGKIGPQNAILRSQIFIPQQQLLVHRACHVCQQSPVDDKGPLSGGLSLGLPKPEEEIHGFDAAAQWIQKPFSG